MNREIGSRRPCINSRIRNFYFSVGFDPYTGQPVEFFITGRGKVGQQLDPELYEHSVKLSKLMQGEFEDDLSRLREGAGAGAARPEERRSASVQGSNVSGEPREILR